ncbi:NYN domain-containing protein [Massilia sp. CF038]|uniref:NYN domain-containing protein n=1 Tax=Massilia sp. CF038 TaxID=1881045 RepID=UPI000912AFB6|nr:NYN domain-containing protein [Massilia sp. CF038]SHG57077.1 Uncharacterized conserved protein, LabA/DUF88 family [Massilia sp. CF038]
MASSNDNISMAVFCDFENVALGVRDANYEKFDIKPVLERLLLKGSIVVKKAYCDWERYKGFKATMHEANFELIEIPHVRQSGKNSADIRLVVDALDLCYTKSHVNTFVIISGDSDFSPLVSKLRENAKQVIGVGVKQSTSDLLVANCDEFIFYDDLVREVKRAAAKRDERKQPPARKSPDEGNRRKEEMEARKAQAIELVVEMFDALVSERGDSGKIWASLLKDTLKRRRPDFNETYYGFRTFGNLLEEAQNRGMLEFGRDEKSGAYVYRSSVPHAVNAPVSEAPATEAAVAEAVQETAPAKSESRRRGGRGGRKQAETVEAVTEVQAMPEPQIQPAPEPEAVPQPDPEVQEKRRAPRGGRKTAPKKEAAPAEVVAEAEPAPAPVPAPAKKAARPRRPAKPKAE